VLLGAFHGLDPAMGWLFAVALGLQRRRLASVIAALALWSFLMATAHGAGLMLAPVLLEQGGRGLALVGVHTVTMLLVMGVVASLVYQTVGLGVLRRAWVNMGLIWAIALIAAGILTAVWNTAAT